MPVVRTDGHHEIRMFHATRTSESRAIMHASMTGSHSASNSPHRPDGCDRRALLSRAAVVVVGGLTAATIAPRAAMASSGAEPFIGEILLVPYSFAPRGWAFCEGQVLPISQHQALFSLIGTKYGGDGRTTLALPDLRKLEQDAAKRLRSSTPVFRYVIALTGMYPSRA